MKIVSLTLENFRSYRTPVTITFNDLTVLIGENEADTHFVKGITYAR